MPTIDPRLIIVFFWIAGCALVTFVLLVRRPVVLPPVSYALVAALIVRLVPALVLPRGAMYEMEVFRQVGQTTFEGQSVYLTRTAYPYLPLQLYWAAAAYWLTGATGLVSVGFQQNACVRQLARGRLARRQQVVQLRSFLIGQSYDILFHAESSSGCVLVGPSQG